MIQKTGPQLVPVEASYLRFTDNKVNLLCNCTARESLLTNILVRYDRGSTDDFFCRVRMGRSRSSKVVDFRTNRKCVCNFLLVRPSKPRSCLAPFQRYCRSCAYDPTPIPRFFHLNFGEFPLDQIADVGVNQSRYLTLFSLKLCSKYSNLCDHGT